VRGRERLSLLDWGGGIGHYGVLSEALMPEVPVDYYCKDLPVLCAAGRETYPRGKFIESEEECLGRSYDVVLCSNAIQYSRDWRQTLRFLAGVTGGYLYLARVPVVRSSASFVVVQRPHAAGYRTEYPGWFLNRGELL